MPNPHSPALNTLLPTTTRNRRQPLTLSTTPIHTSGAPLSTSPVLSRLTSRIRQSVALNALVCSSAHALFISGNMGLVPPLLDPTTPLFFFFFFNHPAPPYTHSFPLPAPFPI